HLKWRRRNGNSFETPSSRQSACGGRRNAGDIDMVDQKQLVQDLKPLLKVLEADLRARCDEVTEIDAGLKREYDAARGARRVGTTFEEWRADVITQVAAAWVLSCVFVRFLEDNALIAPPRISGPLHGSDANAGLGRARDEREAYFKKQPKHSD